jgi:hypothetical protein
MKRIGKFIIFFLMGVTVMSVTFYYTCDQTRQILREKFSRAFDRAIIVDMEQRAGGTPMFFFSHPDSSASFDENYFTLETEKGKTVHEKTDRHKMLTGMEKMNNVTQSYLLGKNPVCVSLLDSLFRVELKKEGIVAPTMISYTNNKTKVIQHNDFTNSHSGNSFYATVHPTERRTLGIFDEISLQGFVKVNPMTVIRYASPPFILLLAGGIIIGLLVYVHIFRKEKASVLSGETEPVEPFRLDVFERTFFYPGGSVKLMGNMAFRMFACMWNNDNHFASYEDISLSLYGKGVDADTRKSRMAQTIKTLRGQLKTVPVTIENKELRGYRIICEVKGSFVSHLFNELKRIFRTGLPETNF